jgi:hypothetical protein
MVWVRERTIPTERPPLVGEVIANFFGWRVPRGQRDGSLRPYSRFSKQEPLLFYQVALQLFSRGWVDPVPDPLIFVSGSGGNRTRASGSVAIICSNIKTGSGDCLRNWMQHNPHWENYTRSVIPKIPLALRNQVVHYLAHKSPPPDLVMSPSKSCQHPFNQCISD